MKTLFHIEAYKDSTFEIQFSINLILVQMNVPSSDSIHLHLLLYTNLLYHL